mmetsp:Transcript_13235/g.52777  ORF Transcript_13235/g.52777 Transcript_13235/m.52777 type:complete len:276 (-) Transcript_13235:2758-3585(-)
MRSQGRARPPPGAVQHLAPAAGIPQAAGRAADAQRARQVRRRLHGAPAPRPAPHPVPGPARVLHGDSRLFALFDYAIWCIAARVPANAGAVLWAMRGGSAAASYPLQMCGGDLPLWPDDAQAAAGQDGARLAGLAAEGALQPGLRRRQPEGGALVAAERGSDCRGGDRGREVLRPRRGHTPARVRQRGAGRLHSRQPDGGHARDCGGEAGGRYEGERGRGGARAEAVHSLAASREQSCPTGGPLSSLPPGAALCGQRHRRQQHRARPEGHLPAPL